jgi:NAD(P)H-nitrite reductase large subunit
MPSLQGTAALFGQWGRIAEGFSSIKLLMSRGVPYRMGWGILAAHGDGQVEGATIARLDAQWRPVPGSEREVVCDTICTGYGFTPFNALAKLAGVKQSWHPELGGEVPVRDAFMQTSVEGIYAVGDGAGIGGYKMAMLEGTIAGASAAAVAAEAAGAALGANATIRQAQLALRGERRFQRFYASLFTPPPGLYELAQEDTLICRCEGIHLREVENAIRSGANSLQEIKAVTRCGMGECQGRVCGTQVAHITSRLTGRALEEIGSYSARPPLFPVPVGAFMD